MIKNEFTFTKNFAIPEVKLISKSVGLQLLKAKFMSFGKPEDGDTPDAQSLLGTPVFDTLTFYGNGTNGQISYYDMVSKSTVTVDKLVLDVALCVVTKNINVVKTKIAGRPGTVKQYINLGDYDININGVFTSGITDTRPEDKIIQLHKITNATGEVNVASNYLHLYGINSVVFERVELPQNQEGRDVQHFQIECVSETSFAIKINSK